MSGFEGGSAVLHSSYNCPTRQLPAPYADESCLAADISGRRVIWRAFKFTQAICQDIEAANQAGIAPVLISVGLDGWASDERKLLPWLRASRLDFQLVLRINSLSFGMSAGFCHLDNDVY